jgi:hypothetical protein
MLTGLFEPKYNDLAQEQNNDDSRMMRVATMDPFQQAGFAALQGGNMMGRGLGEALAGVAGLDTRSPVKRNLDAVEAAKAQVAQLGFDPADPKSIDEFYKRVIQILQKQGLAAEALDVAREWHKQKNEDAQTAAKTDEVARKRTRGLQTDARAQERNRILEKKGACRRRDDPAPEPAGRDRPARPRRQVQEGRDPRAPERALRRQGREVREPRRPRARWSTPSPARDPLGDVGAKPMSAKDAAKAEQTTRR